MEIDRYWDAALAQRPDEMRTFFWPEAWVNWHNTGEHFSVEEFIRANCEYPGEWTGKIERVEQSGDLIVTAVAVCSTDRKVLCHVVSFIKVRDGKIASIDEYWGDDGPVPQWRLDKHIGTQIEKEKG